MSGPSQHLQLPSFPLPLTIDLFSISPVTSVSFTSPVELIAEGEAGLRGRRDRWAALTDPVERPHVGRDESASRSRHGGEEGGGGGGGVERGRGCRAVAGVVAWGEFALPRASLPSYMHLWRLIWLPGRSRERRSHRASRSSCRREWGALRGLRRGTRRGPGAGGSELGQLSMIGMPCRLGRAACAWGGQIPGARGGFLHRLHFFRRPPPSATEAALLFSRCLLPSPLRVRCSASARWPTTFRARTTVRPPGPFVLSCCIFRTRWARPTTIWRPRGHSAAERRDSTAGVPRGTWRGERLGDWGRRRRRMKRGHVVRQRSDEQRGVGTHGASAWSFRGTRQNPSHVTARVQPWGPYIPL